MSAYNELPDDFKNHWKQNKLHELYYFKNITKEFKKEGKYINIYTYNFLTSKRIKSQTESQKYIYYLKYNTSTLNYELNGRRYSNYKDTIKDM